MYRPWLVCTAQRKTHIDVKIRSCVRLSGTLKIITIICHIRHHCRYKLQVLLRTERATALITQKIEKEDKENIEK